MRKGYLVSIGTASATAARSARAGALVEGCVAQVVFFVRAIDGAIFERVNAADTSSCVADCEQLSCVGVFERVDVDHIDYKKGAVRAAFPLWL
ncbi:MAG: hypothetical protein NVSMB64_25460 [Candidatus Velthaea sp.]